jgi:copper oxidase (laccase) domain-containing protein
VVSALRLGGADTTVDAGIVLAGTTTDADAAAPAALAGAEVRFTGRAEGDMADPDGRDPAVTERRRALIDRPWTSLRQVHGAGVVRVTRPGEGTGQAADAAVSVVAGAPLAILAADCAPVAFFSPGGVIGGAHAGWRGLYAGVIEATVAAMRELGAGRVVAALGPCIHAECYQFGEVELNDLVNRFGPDVRARDRNGAAAFDLPAAVRIALARADAELAWDAGICTACSTDHWSWRARREAQRQAMVVWLP